MSLALGRLASTYLDRLFLEQCTWHVPSPVAAALDDETDPDVRYAREELAKLGAQAFLVAADHLAAFSAVLDGAPRNIVTSPATMARGCIEAAARSYHLLEADLSGHRAVARWANEELESIHEHRLVFERHPELAAAGTPDFEDYQAWIQERVTRVGLVVTATPPKRPHLPPVVTDSEGPRRERRLGERERLLQVPVPERLGKDIYALYSGIAHSRGWAISQFIRTTGETSPAGHAMATYTATPSQEARIYRPVIDYITQAAGRLYDAFAWQATKQERLDQHAAEVVLNEIGTITATDPAEVDHTTPDNP